jgi:hypothetical protein
MPQELDERVLRDLLSASVIVRHKVDRSDNGRVLDGEQPPELVAAVHPTVPSPGDYAY